MPIFFLSHLSSHVFSPSHDKHFETHKKISCTIDESIIYPLLYHTIHRPIWWFDKSNEFIFFFLFFFLEKTAFDLFVFLFSTVWFSSDTTSETTSWITLVCLIVCWDYQPAEYRCIFQWHMFSNQSFYIALHIAPINYFFWTSFRFFFFTIFYLSTLCFDPWIIYHLLAD